MLRVPVPRNFQGTSWENQTIELLFSPNPGKSLERMRANCQTGIPKEFIHQNTCLGEGEGGYSIVGMGFKPVR